MIKSPFEMLRRIWRSEKKTPSSAFAECARQAISVLSAARSKSTIDNYRTAVASFLAVTGDGLRTTDITEQTIQQWLQQLKERGVSLNTISCYMRSLRAVMTHAAPEADMRRLFAHVFTGNTKTVKRALPTEELRRLITMELPQGSSLRFARDVFLFQVYAQGMPLVDVAFLRKRQLSDGYIAYERHKTLQPVRVHVEPPMQLIIDCYSQAESEYVFPILTEGTMREYMSFRTSYNRHLAQLSERAGLSRRLTSYVARHSWASMAYHANVDLPLISRALGHTSSQTTLIYISEIDDQRIDQANRLLLEKICNNV